jgi:hypothetical protein
MPVFIRRLAHRMSQRSFSYSYSKARSELVDLDPHDSTHWLPLHIALGLWRLRDPNVSPSSSVAGWAGRLSRLLRGPDPARTLRDRASCTLIAARE